MIFFLGTFFAVETVSDVTYHKNPINVPNGKSKLEKVSFYFEAKKSISFQKSSAIFIVVVKWY